MVTWSSATKVGIPLINVLSVLKMIDFFDIYAINIQREKHVIS